MAHFGTSKRAVLENLISAPRDPETIRYRQAVFRDIWHNPRLAAAFADTLRSMEELTVFSRSASAGTHPLLESVWRLSELELYVELVVGLRDLLQSHTVESKAFLALRDELDKRIADPGFDVLRTELPRLRAGLKLRRSITLGINLDDRLRPIEAALVSVNDRTFKEGQFLSRFFGAVGADPYITTNALHKTSPDSLIDHDNPGERLPLAPLFQELETVLKGVLRPLSAALCHYVSVTTGLFAVLHRELAFFCGAELFLRRIAGAGHALCFPDIRDAVDRRTEFEGLYNLRLAAHRIETGDDHGIVGNSLVMDGHARLFVLTGPNGGGKTTFTQAVGTACIFAQAGLPVPAVRAVVTPVDRILTHFPVEEDYDDDMGRFEDEVRRVGEMFDRVSDRSLVLLNEPLTSTGPAEAIEIAGEVLAGFALAGVRGIFTTHYHEIAGSLQHRKSEGGAAIGTITAGTAGPDSSERTFRISEGPPAGSSHARDIAQKFGIDLDSIRRRLKR